MSIAILNAFLCVAILVLCSSRSKIGQLSLLSPVGMVAWFGLIYLLLPTVMIYFGFETKWHFLIDERALIEKAQVPYTIFALSGIFVALALRARSLKINLPTYVRPASRETAIVYLSFALIAYFLIFLSGSLMFFSGGASGGENELAAKYLLALVDLAIPGIAIIIFSRDRVSPWLLVLIAVVCLGYVFLGSRYRIAVIGILGVFYILKKGGGFIDSKMIVYLLSGIFLLSVISVGRSYRDGFNTIAISKASSDVLVRGLASDTNIHFTMGAVIDHVPKMQDFVYFEPLYVAITIIVPRSIWPTKPTPDYLSAIPASLSRYGLQESGAALPIYGEWYLSGGYPAIFIVSIILLFLLQVVFLKSIAKGRYALAATISCFCAYSYTRGYLAQNVLSFVFTVVPAYIGYKKFRFG